MLVDFSGFGGIHVPSGARVLPAIEHLLYCKRRDAVVAPGETRIVGQATR